MNNTYTILSEIENNLLKKISQKKSREIFKKINWKLPAISIYGERGIGKTYMLLQHRKLRSEGFYFSADSHLITALGLFNFVYWVYKNHKIRHFYIDEVHAYPQWIQEVKNLIDSLPDVKFIFTGSSSMMLYKGSIDLGRRIRDYHLKTLSFREYLYFKHDRVLPSYEISDIFQNFPQIIGENAKYTSEIMFQKYLKQGYYPYAIEDNFGDFSHKLNKLLDKTLQEDMIGLFNFTKITSVKLQKLFYFLATTTPSELSVNKLSQKIGTNKDLLGEVLFILDKIGIVRLVEKFGKPSDKIRKHHKIFLGNPNIYEVNAAAHNIGTIRESFFLSQLQIGGFLIEYIKDGDYAIYGKNDQKFFVEIGGKSKTAQQLKNNDGYVITDDFYGSDSKIPLWVFGLIKTSCE